MFCEFFQACYKNNQKERISTNLRKWSISWINNDSLFFIASNIWIFSLCPFCLATKQTKSIMSSTVLTSKKSFVVITLCGVQKHRFCLLLLRTIPEVISGGCCLNDWLLWRNRYNGLFLFISRLQYQKDYLLNKEKGEMK